jgi:isopenicillin N synthase-like dioxygenase
MEATGQTVMQMIAQSLELPADFFQRDVCYVLCYQRNAKTVEIGS